jgi:hypothetical protein
VYYRYFGGGEGCDNCICGKIDEKNIHKNMQTLYDERIISLNILPTKILLIKEPIKTSPILRIIINPIIHSTSWITRLINRFRKASHMC